MKDGKGSWTFKGYKEDKKVINKGNVQFLGLWEYQEPEPNPEPNPEPKPKPKPEQPSTSVETSTSVFKQELPNTGTEELATFTPAVLAILGGLGLAAPALTKKKDEE